MWKIRALSSLSITLISGAIILLMTLGLTNLSFFTVLELKGLDVLFNLRGSLPTSNQIVIVAIDESSLAEIQKQWPWPRSFHARLIEQLNRAGAKVIGLDILFAEPSDPAEDEALERALRDAGNVVLVSTLAVVNDPLFRLTTRVDPLPAFAQATTVGSPIVNIDADGIVRRTRLLYPDPGQSSFALQIVGKFASAPEREQLGKQDLANVALINYLGPSRTLKTVSYYQALDYERLLPPDIFAGKIVLVGRSLEAIPEPQNLSGDTFLTPFSWSTGNPTAGVEIQATIVDNLLQKRFIAEFSKPAQMALLLALIASASLLLVKFGPQVGVLALGILATLFLLTAHVAFSQANVWLPIFTGVLSLILTYGGYLLVRVIMAERERRRTLEETNRTLEAKIRERTGELSKANDELKAQHCQLETAYKELARTQEQLIHSEKMASLGLLVAGIAHELNNPISYVHSNLDFIQEYTEKLIKIITVYANADQENSERRRQGDELKKTTKFEATIKTLSELIDSCKEGVERVKKIVLDLRTFSRTDDDGLMLVNLHEGIESTLNLLAKEYKGRISAHRDYAALPLVECHPSQLNQVFMNLLLNAAQAIPEKGDVWIKTEMGDNGVKIRIRDNGIGIPEKNLTNIFDPFFTTKPIGQGTGLGLSISYSIIKKHQGTIRVLSNINEGTEFIVELPLRMVHKVQ